MIIHTQFSIWATARKGLTPDFIPVLEYLDELLLLPIGIWIVLRLVPVDVLEECRALAACWPEDRRPGPRSYIGAALIIALWLTVLWPAWRWTESWLAY